MTIETLQTANSLNSQIESSRLKIEQLESLLSVDGDDEVLLRHRGLDIKIKRGLFRSDTQRQLTDERAKLALLESAFAVL